MCKVLKFPRSTYYSAINHKQSNKEKEYEDFSKKVMFFYNQSKGRYGAVKLQRDIEESGTHCSIKRVQRHMTKLGLRSIVIRKYQYKRNYGKIPDDKENILNRNFKAAVFKKLVTDIIYLRQKGRIDLSCVSNGSV